MSEEERATHPQEPAEGGEDEVDMPGAPVVLTPPSRAPSVILPGEIRRE
jgi:hypothetical protein